MMVVMKRYHRILAALGTGTLAVAAGALPLDGGTTVRCPDVAAHRGAASVAPEETLPAIVAAAKQGADYVDFDIQWTRSSVAVLMHDTTIDRTTNGTGLVSSYYLSQLQTFDAGSSFSPVYAGERVPTLGAALRALSTDPDVIALPELKGYVDDGKLGVYATAAAGNGMTGRVVTQSFWPSTLQRLNAIAPSLPLGLTTANVLPDPVASVRAAKATYWLPQASTVTAESVAAAQAAGITVIPWGAEDRANWERLTDLGVDALLTDRPGPYAGWRLARCDY